MLDTDISITQYVARSPTREDFTGCYAYFVAIVGYCRVTELEPKVAKRGRAGTVSAGHEDIGRNGSFNRYPDE
jgi:hypothetical protein